MSRGEAKPAPDRRGVIFDLDGTLVDSAPDVALLLNAVLRPHVAADFSVAEAQRLMGEGIAATITKALTARGCTASPSTIDGLQHDFHQRYLREPVQATRPYPHASTVLSALARSNIAIGVCTNKAEAPARLVLEHTGLIAHVGPIIGADSGHGMKPASTPLLACARQLGVALPEITYVGDHAIDLATGRAAGVCVILAAYGYGGSELPLLRADGAIHCLSDLPRLLQITV